MALEKGCAFFGITLSSHLVVELEAQGYHEGDQFPGVCSKGRL